jgi:hypothetical protein
MAEGFAELPELNIDIDATDVEPSAVGEGGVPPTDDVYYHEVIDDTKGEDINEGTEVPTSADLGDPVIGFDPVPPIEGLTSGGKRLVEPEELPDPEPSMRVRKPVGYFTVEKFYSTRRSKKHSTFFARKPSDPDVILIITSKILDVKVGDQVGVEDVIRGYPATPIQLRRFHSEKSGFDPVELL